MVHLVTPPSLDMLESFLIECSTFSKLCSKGLNLLLFITILTFTFSYRPLYIFFLLLPNVKSLDTNKISALFRYAGKSLNSIVHFFKMMFQKLKSSFFITRFTFTFSYRPLYIYVYIYFF